MSAKKREIYARMATQLRHHERAAKAEKACPGAMGLYLFLNLQSRGEETHGETFEDIAYASWGAPLAYRRRQAKALIEAGLVERVGDDLVVVKYLEHNDGPEEIAENKAAANKRRKESDERRKKVELDASLTRESRVPDASESSSISCSLSGSESSSREPDTTREANVRPLAEIPDPFGDRPAWWAEAVRKTSENSLGRSDALNPGECWIAYAGHRAKKRLPASANDAGTWLVTVMVEKARKRIREEAEAAERGATFAARFPPKSDVAPMMPYKLAAEARDEPTPEELAEVRKLAAKGMAFLDAAANDTPKTGTDE